MGPDLSHITAFTEHVGSGAPRPRFFYALDPPGEHYYLFRPTRAAFETVAGMIAGERAKRKLGAYSLRACGRFHPLARLIPGVSSRSVDVAIEFEFDVAVFSNRTRLLTLDEETVYTMQSSESDQVAQEVRVRTELPPEINTPELYTYDLSYPYFSEQLISGRHPTSPVTGWDHLLDGLEQLTYLYRLDPESVSTTTVVERTYDRLDQRGLLDEQPFETAFDLAERLGLPERLYRATTHGDYHTRNLIIDGNTRYIVDWEACGRDLVIRDFFRPFTTAYYDIRDPTSFVELCSLDGRGGVIFDQYINTIGEHAIPDPSTYRGLPVLHLLIEISQKRQVPRWNSNHELLMTVVDRLD